MIKTVAIALLISISVSSFAQANLKVDANSARMLWKGKQVTGEHSGTIRIKSGSIGWGTQGLTSAVIEMDMSTITDTDMEREWAAELEGHLSSPDFFNTAAFKTATFKTTNVARIDSAEAGKPNYTVTGDLTIKGITHPVTLDVLAWKDKQIVRAAGILRFDRTLYDIKYRSGQFFSALGDKMINDTVELTFDITGK